MTKKALILDLDNTLYAVPSIGDRLFADLYRVIEESGAYSGSLQQIRDEIMRKPFQVVAARYGFSPGLTERGLALLQGLTWEGPIEPFEDYAALRQLPVDKFLVTTGFLLLQQSKIRGMGIENDFREVHIVDPATTTTTKKDVFADIVQRYDYRAGDVLVVGDDPQSEIRAARELGLEAVLYDKESLHGNEATLPRIRDFRQLEAFL